MPWNVCYDHLVFGGNTTMMFGKFCPVNKGFTKYACLLATLCLTSPAWANLVQNGNFGTGDFTDWTANSSANHPWLIETAGYDGLDPYPGDTYFASTGCVGAQCITGTAVEQSSLAQSLATTLGDTYTLTFQFYTGANNGAPNELDVLWDGVSVKDLGPGGTLGAIPAYTLYTVTGLVGTGSDTLTFLGRQDPGYDALDNVDVELSGTGNNAVPEPSSISFAVAGLFGILLAARRYVKKSA
jgi:hypothetical protein